MFRLPSSSAIVAAAARVGSHYRADMRPGLDGTVEATLRRCLHVCAAAAFCGLATGGPFGARNAAVAIEATAAFYREHGFELAVDGLEPFAEVAAAGYLDEADVATVFELRTRLVRD